MKLIKKISSFSELEFLDIVLMLSLFIFEEKSILNVSKYFIAGLEAVLIELFLSAEFKRVGDFFLLLKARIIPLYQISNNNPQKIIFTNLF